MDANIVLFLSSVVSAVSTLFIALYSWQSYHLAQRNYELSIEIKRMNDAQQAKDEQHKQQASDLYQAITVATLISGPTSVGAISEARDMFNSLYKGKRRFLDEIPVLGRTNFQELAF